MKVVMCLLLACLLAMAYAQTATTGGSTSGLLSSSRSRGGGLNQMLLMAAMNGNDNARIMLTCNYMNIPLFLCMQQMA